VVLRRLTKFKAMVSRRATSLVKSAVERYGAKGRERRFKGIPLLNQRPSDSIVRRREGRRPKGHNEQENHECNWSNADEQDFELAFWQLTYLVVAPRRVYKQTYHQWASQIYLLLTQLMCIANKRRMSGLGTSETC
jgi:hypothetical protein